MKHFLLTTRFSAGRRVLSFLALVAACALPVQMNGQDNGFVEMGGELYFEIVGTPQADEINLFTEVDDDGDVVFRHFSNGVLLQLGEVESDDIALAEFFSGSQFQGFLVSGLAGQDDIDLSGVINHGAMVFGGSGDDNILGTQQDDQIAGGGGMDVIQGLAGDDAISGNGAMDFILGGYGEDRLSGGVGNDAISGGPDNDIVIGGIGADLLAGDGGIDRILGGPQADQIVGDALDFVRGGAQFDAYFLDAAGSDAPLIYENFDIEFVNASRVVSYDLFAKTVTPGALVDRDDCIDSRPYVVPPAGTGVTVKGGQGVDKLFGSDGSDWLCAGPGNDEIYGSPGADHLDGEAGVDMLTYELSTGGVTADLCEMFGARSFAAGDELLNFESLTGSQFDDILRGDDFGNLIFGLGGADSIVGKGGDDNIFAGDGNDRIFGQDGDDLLDGQNGNDTVIGGAGDDSLFGRDGDDFLVGNAGVDQLTGGEGVDRLESIFVGGSSIIDDSFIFGGSGDDVFRIRNVGDPQNEFIIRSHLGDEAISDFEANDDDELVLIN